MLRGIEEMEADWMKKAMQEGMQECRIFSMHCENFATIAKILQSLRNFRYAHFFAMIAKFRYHSENSLS